MHEINATMIVSNNWKERIKNIKNKIKLFKEMLKKLFLTQKRFIVSDVIPIVSRMLYDSIRVDHKNSENLKGKKN